jgi:hypothetical protein
MGISALVVAKPNMLTVFHTDYMLAISRPAWKFAIPVMFAHAQIQIIFL